MNYVLAGLGLFGLGLLVFRRKKKKVSDPGKAPASYPVPSGWRRAQSGEVTGEMVSNAWDAMSSPLGTVVEYGDHAILVEWHHDKKRGWHKGASVLVPA